jgi:peptide/nickel transport system ATP-binding protein
METQAPLLQVQHLSVGIKQDIGFLNAVDDISFHLNTGEILGIVGESGCGKSLTALSIAGLLPQGVRITGGNSIFDSMDVSVLSQQDFCDIRGKTISMIFQEPMTSLNPLLKIGPQIAEPLELHGRNDKKALYAEVLDIMQKVGLPDPKKLAAAYPHQLSGGMRQRVMIALAIVGKPKLLIADEPTTALDVTIQAQILHLLKQINREFGTSILFISHDLGVISQICNRVLVMYAGKLVEEGRTETILFHPLHEYTKGLLGSIPTKEQKGKALVNIPGKVPSLGERGRGCPFAPRCWRAQWDCFDRFPDAYTLKDGRRVHCILAKVETEGNHA